MPFNQRQILEQGKFAYTPLEKAFEKQSKSIEEKSKKEIDAINNQNKRLKPESLTSKNDYKDDAYKDNYYRLFTLMFN